MYSIENSSITSIIPSKSEFKVRRKEGANKMSAKSLAEKINIDIEWDIDAHNEAP